MYDHDYQKYPELSNTELQVLQFSSPHTQIVEDFEAKVVKVYDGDTITLRATFRDFDFRLRFLDIDAPEMNAGGNIARDWLISRILGKVVNVLIDKTNRVGKYGRLLGKVLYNGTIVSEEMIHLGLAKEFINRNEGEIPDINKVFRNEWQA